MSNKKKTFIIDIDYTILYTYKEGSEYKYDKSAPIKNMFEKINLLFDEGHRIILYTARGMRTYNNDLALVEKNHRNPLEDFLNKYKLKYHELVFGKMFYEDYFFVDDRNLTINQFLTEDSKTFEKICNQNKNKQSLT